MDKRDLRHWLKELRRIGKFYLLTGGVVFGLIAVYAIRDNNFKMIKLSEELVSVDQANGDTEKALNNLRQFIYGHMNTNPASSPNAIKPPIQLKYSFDRAVQAEKDRVSAINAGIYTEGQKTCEKQFPGSVSGGPRVPCIQDYVAKNGVSEKHIDDSLYKYDFVSPAWSPDVAGWSLLVSIAFMMLFLVRFGLERWLKSELSA